MGQAYTRLAATMLLALGSLATAADAVRAEATLGEICDLLREEWGEYREPARF